MISNTGNQYQRCDEDAKLRRRVYTESKGHTLDTRGSDAVNRAIAGLMLVLLIY